MKRFEIIQETAEQKFGSFRRFCIETGQDYSNFKRKLLANLIKVNKWLEPLGLEIKIEKKNPGLMPGVQTNPTKNSSMKKLLNKVRQNN